MHTIKLLFYLLQSGDWKHRKMSRAFQRTGFSLLHKYPVGTGKKLDRIYRNNLELYHIGRRKTLVSMSLGQANLDRKVKPNLSNASNHVYHILCRFVTSGWLCTRPLFPHIGPLPIRDQGTVWIGLLVLWLPVHIWRPNNEFFPMNSCRLPGRGLLYFHDLNKTNERRQKVRLRQPKMIKFIRPVDVLPVAWKGGDSDRIQISTRTMCPFGTIF